MATIALSVVGGAIAGVVSGGNPAAIKLGMSIGALVGGVVDQSLRKPQDVGRMQDIRITGSSYGAAIPWVWGVFRFGGNIFWWSDFRETKRKKGSKLAGTRTNVYTYSVDVAVGICRGPVTSIKKIYAEDILIYDEGSGTGAEVQTITIGTNTSGIFQIEFRGATTTGLNWDDTGAAIQADLEALPTIGTGNITVTGPAEGPWLATFIGALAGQNVPRMDMIDGTLSGGSGQGITTSQQGGTTYDIDLYLGTESQTKNATIVANKGVNNTPAYRGWCYVVFNDFDLGKWGNRMPNFSFVVERHSDSYPEMIVNDGAYVYYRMEDYPGLLVDYTNRQLNMSVVLNSFTQLSAGKYGEALSAASTTATARVTHTPRSEFVANRITIELWFQYKGGAASGNGSSQFVTARSNNAWNVTVEPNMISAFTVIRLRLCDPVGNFISIINTVSTARDTLWHHLAVVVDTIGGTSKVYQDGVLLDTQILTQTSLSAGLVPDDTQDTTIHLADNYRFDEVAFYPRALTDAEVLLHATFVQDIAKLKHILQEIFVESGIPEYQFDVSSATNLVRGWMLDGRIEGRQAAEPPCRAFMTDLVEQDGKILSVPRGGSIVASIPEEDLGTVISASEATDLMEVKRTGERELPFALEVTYFNETMNFESGHERALRPTKQHLRGQITIPFPLVMTATEARQLSEKLLAQVWTERREITCQVLPQWAKLVPTDVISLPLNGELVRARIEQQELDLPGVVGLQLYVDESDDLTQNLSGSVLTDQSNLFSFSNTTAMVAFNGNASRDEDTEEIGIHVAANGEEEGEWAGATLYMSRDGGSSYQEVATLLDDGTFGETDTVLAAGVSTGLFDDVNTVDVTITNGTDNIPTTASDSEVLAGDNGAVIGDEYIQFGTVTALGGDSYRLSHLLRGRRGTDAFWDEHRTGERVIFNDGGVSRVSLPFDLLGKIVQLKAVGDGEDIADISPISVMLYGRELLAWSPVQFEGTRDISDNLTLTWNRRARKNNSLQDLQDIPLDFDSEFYEIYVPNETTASIAGITQEQQAVVYIPANPYSVGQKLYFSGVVGMLEINNLIGEIISINGDLLSMDIDARDFQSYVSGGDVARILRTITVSAPTATYTAAEQATDGFTLGDPLLLVLHQIGDDGRRGYATVEVI